VYALNDTVLVTLSRR